MRKGGIHQLTLWFALLIYQPWQDIASVVFERRSRNGRSLEGLYLTRLFAAHGLIMLK